jgi:hypothetical protein
LLKQFELVIMQSIEALNYDNCRENGSGSDDLLLYFMNFTKQDREEVVTLSAAKGLS